MRIVGGRLGGRSLKGPASDKIRPTSDRLRESLFNILEHSYGGVADLRIVDLFAGTGALALEALSRGARFALLVDDGTEARSLLRANIEGLGLGGVTRVFRRDARKLGLAPAGDRFDLAFLDPPYGHDLAPAALAALRDGQWLAADALAIVEEAKNVALAAPEGFADVERRLFGDTQIAVFRRLACT